MVEREIEIGRQYAYRRTRSGAPRKVKVVEKTGKKGQVKIRYIDDPHAGLEEWTKTRWLVVPWGEVKRFLRDEEREARAREASQAVGDAAHREAVNVVLSATGEGNVGIDWMIGTGDGLLSGPVEDVRRIAVRAGLSDNVERTHPGAYIDRHGELVVPFEGALQLARAFAQAEPEAVTRYIESEEAEYKAHGYEPGERWHHDRLRDLSPAFALVRQWAGFEVEVDELRKEIARVRTVAELAASELKRLGAEREARRVKRALAGR